MLPRAAGGGVGWGAGRQGADVLPSDMCAAPTPKAFIKTGEPGPRSECHGVRGCRTCRDDRKGSDGGGAEREGLKSQADKSQATGGEASEPGWAELGGRGNPEKGDRSPYKLLTLATFYEAKNKYIYFKNI